MWPLSWRNTLIGLETRQAIASRNSTSRVGPQIYENNIYIYLIYIWIRFVKYQNNSSVNYAVLLIWIWCELSTQRERLQDKNDRRPFLQRFPDLGSLQILLACWYAPNEDFTDRSRVGYSYNERAKLLKHCRVSTYLPGISRERTPAAQASMRLRCLRLRVGGARWVRQTGQMLFLRSQDVTQRLWNKCPHGSCLRAEEARRHSLHLNPREKRTKNSTRMLRSSSPQGCQDSRFHHLASPRSASTSVVIERVARWRHPSDRWNICVAKLNPKS